MYGMYDRTSAEIAGQRISPWRPYTGTPTLERADTIPSSAAAAGALQRGVDTTLSARGPAFQAQRTLPCSSTGATPTKSSPSAR